MTQLKTNFFVTILVGLLSTYSVYADKKDSAKVDTFKFTIQKQLKITPIKNQASSGTCWCYSTIGFIESELMRTGKPELDLSEMFVVHHSYTDKADKYVRLYGEKEIAGGGSFGDVIYVLKHYGIVPQTEMTGLNYGEEKNNHGELDKLIAAYVGVIAKKPLGKHVSTAWKKGLDGILDAYLGECPKEFTVDGKKYSPMTYMQSLGLNMDDYISLTSFTHHPYYTKFPVEIPDNWRWEESYNLPLDEFMQVFDYAINNGYTIAWASDVSEKGFSGNGVAVDPITKKDNIPGTDQAKWLNLSQKDIDDYKYDRPCPEITVTPEIRQRDFDNLETTDDHGMQIFGTATDQLGNKYYMVKNSWGDGGKRKGIWYASVPFVMHKTIDILVHKNAIPKELRKKLNIN